MMKGPSIIIVLFVFICLLLGAAFKAGKMESFQQIMSGQCWLNKENRDIECVEVIAE